METLSTGLTWRQVQEKFDEDAAWELSLCQHRRRAKKSLRQRGEAEERKIWRLIVQQRSRNQVRTRLRKNVRSGEDNLLAQPVGDKLIARLNSLIASA